MRAILDTNVVVSGLIWGGAPLGLIDAAAVGRVELFTSPILFAELEGVLQRAHLVERLRRVRGPVEDALAFYARLATFVNPAALSDVVPDDPDDDHVVAAAVAARADVIVSGDRHLLVLGCYGAVRILRPAEALGEIMGGLG